MITVFPNSCGVSVNFEIHVLLLEIATLSAVSDSSAAAGLWGPCRHLAERPSPDTRDVSSPAVRCSTRFICKNPCGSHNSPIGWLPSSSLPASGMETEDGAVRQQTAETGGSMAPACKDAAILSATRVPCPRLLPTLRAVALDNVPMASLLGKEHVCAGLNHLPKDSLNVHCLVRPPTHVGVETSTDLSRGNTDSDVREFCHKRLQPISLGRVPGGSSLQGSLGRQPGPWWAGVCILAPLEAGLFIALPPLD